VPYFTIKNSQGGNWGQNGFGKILIEDGVGVCAIQAEAALPALLLSSDTLQTTTIFILLGITLGIMVPLSFYFWYKSKDSLHYMNPG
jgi:hypothetical protein